MIVRGRLGVRWLLVVALVICAWTYGAAQTPQEPPKENFVKAHYTKYEYRIPMRDGKRLFTAVYVPKESAFQSSAARDSSASARDASRNSSSSGDNSARDVAAGNNGGGNSAANNLAAANSLPQTYPILMQRTPYSVGPYGVDQYRA